MFRQIPAMYYPISVDKDRACRFTEHSGSHRAGQLRDTLLNVVVDTVSYKDALDEESSA